MKIVVLIKIDQTVMKWFIGQLHKWGHIFRSFRQYLQFVRVWLLSTCMAYEPKDGALWLVHKLLRGRKTPNKGRKSGCHQKLRNFVDVIWCGFSASEIGKQQSMANVSSIVSKNVNFLSWGGCHEEKQLSLVGHFSQIPLICLCHFLWPTL